MDQRKWEDRLDRAADRVSHVVADGVHMLEDVYEKGKHTINDEMNTRRENTGTTSETSDAGSNDAAPQRVASKGTPRLGLILVGLGIVWLLNTLNILDQPVFPIMLIVLGVYFIARSK